MPEINFNGFTISDEHLHVVLRRIAGLFDKNIEVRSGDRKSVVTGSNQKSLHLARRAVDFHVAGFSDADVFKRLRANTGRVFDRSEGYEIIHHGRFTSTGGPHIHIGHYLGKHQGQALFKTEGLTPGTGGQYKVEAQPITGTGPLETPTLARLTGSVGQKGRNLPKDVKTVQTLMNLARLNLIQAGIAFEPFDPLDDDSEVGDLTLGAIKIFQRNIVGLKRPDRRIDPDGRTWRVLLATARNDPEQMQALRKRTQNVPLPAPDSVLTPDAAPELLLTDPRIRAMLDVIGFSEGTNDNYGVVVRGKVIGPANSPLLGKINVIVTELNDHPRLLVRVNPAINSTAAGRYQFLIGTWDGLGLPDFSPRSQDLGAIKLMKRRKMIEPLLNNDFDLAVQRGCKEWASFPDAAKGGQSHFGGQPAHSLAKLRSKYQEALQTHSGDIL
jgi:muramidase (phage lysozyme)